MGILLFTVASIKITKVFDVKTFFSLFKFLLGSDWMLGHLILSTLPVCKKIAVIYRVDSRSLLTPFLAYVKSDTK